MQIIKAEDIAIPKTRCVLYAQAGMGKTTVAKLLSQKYKILVVDVDRSTVVLRGCKNIDIIYLAEDLENRVKDSNGKAIGIKKEEECSLVECVDFIEKNAKSYDLIFFDNISQLEKNMLTVYGSKGKNDGVPSQGDYQKMQFKVYDYIKKILLSNTNIILTSWEIVGNTVNADNGETGLRLEPQMSTKIVNYVLGLCNVVAHYEKKKTNDGTEKRYLRLSASPHAYAKDQINGRKWCELHELLEGLPAESNK